MCIKKKNIIPTHQSILHKNCKCFIKLSSSTFLQRSKISFASSRSFTQSLPFKRAAEANWSITILIYCKSMLTDLRNAKMHSGFGMQADSLFSLQSIICAESCKKQ